jgi:hypothetical protein
MSNICVMPEKPDITQLILAVLSPFPYGLTTREIRGLTGMASYNASAKLSKLAASGVIGKITLASDYRHRWRVKPRSAAERETVPASELTRETNTSSLMTDPKH